MYKWFSVIVSLYVLLLAPLLNLYYIRTRKEYITKKKSVCWDYYDGLLSLCGIALFGTISHTKTVDCALIESGPVLGWQTIMLWSFVGINQYSIPSDFHTNSWKTIYLNFIVDGFAFFFNLKNMCPSEESVSRGH